MDGYRYILSHQMDGHETTPRNRLARGPVGIIAIAGPSCSGKSTLVGALESHWGLNKVASFPLDAYYRDQSELPMSERVHCNFDAPDAIDWSLLRAHLADVKTGKTVKRPVYDFATHTRTARHVLLESRPILIVEGIFALWSKAIRDLAAVRVYMELPPEESLARRILRDGAKRGRTGAQVREQFARFVQPMAERFVIPTRRFADVVVRGDHPVEESAQRVIRLWEDAQPSG